MSTLQNFETCARNILRLPIQYRVNEMGGYGPSGETIFERHPINCPSSLTINHQNATATFLTNGSTEFGVKHPGGFNAQVLDASFDPVEKRETGVPSSNVWIAFAKQFASIINPQANWGLYPTSFRIIKMNAPYGMWFCASFSPTADTVIETATQLTMFPSAHGHVLQRNIYLHNTGHTSLTGDLWTYFHLHGTQRFFYHKPLWYDLGFPLSATETITAARMPHEDLLQIKRVSTQAHHITPLESTCDYSSFIGDSAAFSVFPQAVQQGHLLDLGAKDRLNRFTTSSISANRFSFDLSPDQSASLIQSLLYLEDETLIKNFRDQITCQKPGYSALEEAFRQASSELVGATSSILKSTRNPLPRTQPPFELVIPAAPAISAYISSLWSGVDELYEKCRSHGAMLADGIEVGTRDRAQDMLAKMKADPARVRTDLLHAFGFMYLTDAPSCEDRMTLSQKLHGLFPRQYPSRWVDRKMPVQNDNRPYADSALWLIDSLLAYIRETGDLAILHEQVGTIHLLDPHHPETSGIIGAEKKLQVSQVIKEIFLAFKRHMEDSPYGLAQILFGDWCDPVDMFGTDEVGNPSRRGHGRGAQVRLSAHLCLCLVHAVDVFSVPDVSAALGADAEDTLEGWKNLANRLRLQIVRIAWENNNFVDCIHELGIDGSQPDYAKGKIGYTLGSMQGSDFDGACRSVLTTQAYCLEMLRLERAFLDELESKTEWTRSLLQHVDTALFHPELGLRLFSTPIANTQAAIQLVGRMGILPAGCAENGEYHHAQMFMHTFRLRIPGQADTVWEQFKPLLSVGRSGKIGGPFDMTSNSYASDPDDPHYAEGMYFGLSGSVDWIIEFIQTIAGLTLALHDDSQPDIQIDPILPEAFHGEFTFKRIIHKTRSDGGYRSVPFSLHVERQGKGTKLTSEKIFVNGRQVKECAIRNVNEFDAIEVHITHVYEGQS